MQLDIVPSAKDVLKAYLRPSHSVSSVPSDS